MDSRDVTFLSPMAPSDIERCELLLESLEHQGSPFRHVVVVDTEHMATLGARLQAHSPGVEVIATADVLDPRTERRRHRPVSRKRPAYWLGGHWRDEPRIYSWWLQQVIKLAYTSVERSAAVVVADTDLVALRPPTPADFLSADGTPLLLEGPSLDAEEALWEIEAMRFLGVPLQGNEVCRHTFEPVIYAPAAVRELVEHLGGASRWVDTFLSRHLVDCPIHGAWRRYRSAVPLATASPSALARSVRFARDTGEWHRVLESAQEAGVAFFHSQSTLRVPVPEIRAAVGIRSPLWGGRA